MQILYSPTTQFITISMLWILLVRSACLCVYSKIFTLVCQCISNLRRHINVFIWLVHRFVRILMCIFGPTFFSLVYKSVYFVRQSFRWRTTYILSHPYFFGLQMCVFV